MKCHFKRIVKVSILTIVINLEISGVLFSQKEGERVYDLEPFEFSVDQDVDQILPTSNSSYSTLGTETSILDSMRSISLITQTFIDDKNINKVEALDPYISGAYSSPIFGNIGVPMIRGDLAESYQNGQRKAFNRNSFPISFNGVEQVEVIKGAASAAYGYGNATGGSVYFVTKKPLRNEFESTIKINLGSWDTYQFQVDTSVPLSEILAVRISIEFEDADSFYRLVESDSQSVYFAISYHPNINFNWQFNAEYLQSDFTEIPGTNRPTQELINHGLYITGESISSGGSFFGNTFIPKGLVKIDGSQILLAPGDGARADVYNLQSVLTLTGADSTLTNRTYFESVDAEKRSSYYFNSYLPKSYTFENRTEWKGIREFLSFQHKLLTGVSFRHEYRKSFVDIFNEYFNPFDLTSDPDTFRYPLDQLFGVQLVPGTDGYAIPGGAYPRNDGTGRLTPSLSATLNSTLYNIGVFFEDTVQLNTKWSLLLSTRFDQLYLDSKDPLPRPGIEAMEDSNNKLIFSTGISLRYKPSDYQTYYLTLNSAAAVESSSSSGGFGLVQNEIKDEVLENNSELIELGSKKSLLNDNLFISAAVYYQKRNRISPRNGIPDEIEIFGFEWDVLYQPMESLYIGFVGTYSEAHYIDGPASGTPTTQAPFDPSVPNSTFPRPPLADYRLPGLPHWIVNAFGSYKVTDRILVSGTIQWQSEQNLDLEGFVVIPTQFQLDLALAYRADQWEIRFDIMNITDEFNWRANATPFAGADLVTRELPRNYQLSLKYKF